LFSKTYLYRWLFSQERGMFSFRSNALPGGSPHMRQLNG
jgi:hypothetical protein